MTTALSIILDSYERCNRLSPGEILSADDAAFGLRRLNLLVDELASQPQFLFRSVLTSAAQTGPITLGAGAWAAIAPGETIVSATADGNALAPITMQQYNELYAPSVTGVPSVWAHDGMSTVYLWPVPTGQTIKLQTQDTVSAFADPTTDYVMRAGWANALGAGLAVRVAPVLLGDIPMALLRAERRAMAAVMGYQPAVLDVDTINDDGSACYPARMF